MFAKDLTGCFSHCCVEGGHHWVHVCIFIVHDGERCKLPAYHSMEGFQHVGIFQLFEVKPESCVLARWFLLIQQAVVTSNFCSWKTSSSGTVHSWSVRGANFLPITAWKVSNTLGSFSFLRSNSSLVCFGLLIFSGKDRRSSSASRDHFQCLLLESFEFWLCSLLIGSASSPECNQSGCGVVHLGYAMSIFWILCDDQMCSPTQGRERWQTPEVWVLFHL